MRGRLVIRPAWITTGLKVLNKRNTQRNSIDSNRTEDWGGASNVTFNGLTSAPATVGVTGSITNQVNKYSGNCQNNWKYKVPRMMSRLS